MKLSDLFEKIEEIDENIDEYCDPDVYIKIGSIQVEVSELKYCPETAYEEEAIIIS